VKDEKRKVFAVSCVFLCHSEHSEESISFDCTDVALSLNMTSRCHLKIGFVSAKASGSLIIVRLAHFGFAEDTHARQNASELAFALAYSYLYRR
jgi:hypothetical protein